MKYTVEDAKETDWKAKEKQNRQRKLQRDKIKSYSTDTEINNATNRNAEKQLSTASLKYIKTIKDAEEISELEG